MLSTFNLKRPNKKGKSLIFLKAYFKNEDRKLVYSTGELIPLDEWDFENRMPNNLTGRTKNAEKHREIKLQLDRYSSFFDNVTSLYKKTNQEITIKKIRYEFDKEFKKVAMGKSVFFDAYEEFMDEKIKNKEWGQATIKRYNNIKNILQEFENERKYKLTFSTITKKFYSEFTDYCITSRKHANNTFSRNLRIIKTFLLWSLKSGYTYNEDFREFKRMKRVKTSHIALNKEDLQNLLRIEFKSKKIEHIRDVFVFSCVTGMRFGELKLISKNNIDNDHLNLKEEKGTEKEIRSIPLNEIALYILRKYDNKLPLITNQKHNDYIKDVFKEAGYTHLVEKTATRGKEVIREEVPYYKLISSHTARRTFITMMKRNGKSDKLISKITGHKDMKTLNQYYQVDDDDKKEAVDDTFNLDVPILKKA